MDFEHEGVEMRAAFLADGQRLVEQVHQHRLAAPDPAPEIDPADRRGLAESREEAARCLGFQRPLQRVEPFGRRLLLGIGAQLAGFDERAVASEKAAQAVRSTSIFLVSAIALAGLSPLGHTLAQFMIVWQR